MEGTKTERLIALLHAQRGEAARRAAQVRGSLPWIQSTNRLDGLNDQIMRLSFASAPGSAGVSLGNGLQVELDSRPADDAPFRRRVIDALRQAVATSSKGARLAVASIAPTPEEVDRAELALRTRYPRAALATIADPAASDRSSISLRADRDGTVT